MDDAELEMVGFEQIGLRVGDALRMHLHEASAPPPHHQVQFIGMLKGAGFITTLPTIAGKGMWMAPGTSYVFTTLAGIRVYAFTSAVLLAHARPYPHAHFDYPGAVQARRVRKSSRVRMRLGVAVAGENGETRPATLKDLSLHGALLETAAPLPGDGLRLSLPIKLDEMQSRLQLNGVIRNRSRTEDAAERYGVEFGRLSELEAMLLHYFLDHTVAGC